MRLVAIIDTCGLTAFAESELPGSIVVLLSLNDIVSYVAHPVCGTGYVPTLLLTPWCSNGQWFQFC